MEIIKMDTQLTFNENIHPLRFQTEIVRKSYPNGVIGEKSEIIVKKMDILNTINLTMTDLTRLAQDNAAEDPYSNYGSRDELTSHLAALMADITMLCELYSISLAVVFARSLDGSNESL